MFKSIECNNFSLIDSNVMVIYYSAFIRSSLTFHNQKLYRFDCDDRHSHCRRRRRRCHTQLIQLSKSSIFI